MKQRRIGVDAVEMASRQIECEKILPPHLATAVNARNFDKARRAVEAGRDVPELGESLQIASGPATEIEQSEGTLAANVFSIAAMFCITSCPRVPSQKASAR